MKTHGMSTWTTGRAAVAFAVTCALLMTGASPALADETEPESSVTTVVDGTARWAADQADAAQAAPLPASPDAPPPEALGEGQVVAGAGGTAAADEVEVAFSGHEVDADLDVVISGLDEAAAASAATETGALALSRAFDVSATAPDGTEVTSFPNAVVTDATDVDGARLSPSVDGGEPVTPAPVRSSATSTGPLGSVMAADGLDEGFEGDDVAPLVATDVTPGVRLEVPVDPASLDGIDAGSVRLLTREDVGQPWVEIPSYLDSERHVVVGEVDHLSEFVVIGAKDLGDPRPRVVLDPDDDLAHTSGPNGPATELSYNVNLANEVAARLRSSCNADVLVTRTTPDPAQLSKDVRAGMAAAQDPHVTLTIAFDAALGEPWGNIGNGGTKSYSRGSWQDDQLAGSLAGILPEYTGRPGELRVDDRLPYPALDGLPGAVAHIETLYIDHNFDRVVMDSGLSFVADGVFTSVGTFLENVGGFSCTNPDLGGGWPARPSLAQITSWMHLGFQNYQVYGGDPVSFSTGNLLEQEGLFSLTGPGASSFDMILVYNSQDGRLSRNGYGWTSPVNARAQRFDDGSAMVVRGDGASFVFEPDGAGGFAGGTNHGATLREPGPGRLELTSDDGQVWVFDTSLPEGIGTLVEHRDAEGLATTYAYGATTGDSWFAPLVSVTAPGDQTITFGSDSRGVMTSVTHPDGRVWGLGYDGEQNLTSVTAPDGTVRSFGYDAGHRMVSATDAEGVTYLRNEFDDQSRVVRQWDGDDNVRLFRYDATSTVYTDNEGHEWVYGLDDQKRVVSSTDPSGGVRRLTYGALTNPLTVTAEDGAVTTYAYDAQGRVLSETLADGSTTSYTYSPTGGIASVTDTAGDGAPRTTVRDLDAQDRVVAERSADGSTTSSTYDADGKLLTTTTPTGAVTAFGYDGRGNVVTATDPLGRVTNLAYDASNRLVSTTGPGGATTAYAWDAADRMVSTTDALGGVTSYTYDRNDHVLTETDPTGATTTFAWDRLSRLVSSTTADGATTTYVYDREDNLVASVDPLGARTGFSLDAAYRSTGVVDPLGGVWAQELDPVGRVLSATDPLGAVTGYTYDEVGRLLTQTEPDGAVTEMTYDAAGDVVSTVDPDGGTTGYEYDVAGRLVAVTDPMGAVSTITYDAAGQVVASTDRTGQVSTVEYDAAGQAVATADALGNVTTFEHDEAGNVSSIVDATGAQTTFEHDPLGRTLGVTDALGSTSRTVLDPVGNVLETVDPLGAVTAFTYDAVHRPVSMTDASGAVSTVGWDAAGRQVTSTDPLGVVTAYAYDEAGQLVEVVQNVVDEVPETDVADLLGIEGHLTDEGPTEDATDTNVTTGYEYDAVGNLLSVSDPNGAVTTYDYSPTGQLTGETTPLGASWAYEYSAAGALTTETAPDGVETVYAHDANGDVTSIDYGGQEKVELAYDKNQNPITMVDGTGTTGWSYDALGQQTEQVSPGGERLSVSYTALGQRASVTLPDGSVVGYTYDEAGNPVEQTSPQGDLAYSYDAAHQLTQIDRTGQDGDGLSTFFERDVLGRVTTLTHGSLLADDTDAAGPGTTGGAEVPEVAAGPAPEPAVSDLADATGAPVCRPPSSYLSARTLPGTDAEVVDDPTVTVDYTYDAVGNVVQRDRQDGTTSGESGEYSYDALSRLTGSTTVFETVPAVTTPSAGATVNDPTALSAPMGLLAGQRHLPANDPAATTAPAAVTSSVVAQYGYDRAGNRLRAQTAAPGGTATMTAVLAAGNQLESSSTVITPSAPGVSVPAAARTTVDTAYGYDANGQRTTQQTSTVVPGVTGAPVQETSATELVYGADRKVASITDGDRSTAFTYDGLGRARTQTVATSSVEHTTTNVWDGLSIVARGDDLFGQSAYVRDVTGSLAAQSTTGGAQDGTLWALTDLSGSVIAQAQAAEIAQLSDYDDWGTQDFATTGWSSVFSYTGELTDPALGLSFYYARTYDPATATFTSLDPIDGLLGAPETLNRYVYVLNNPMSGFDMYGYWPSWVEGAGSWVSDNREAITGFAVGMVAAAAVTACVATVVCGGVMAGAVGTAMASGGLTAFGAMVGVGAAGGAVGGVASYAYTDRGSYSWGGLDQALGLGALSGAAGGGVGYGITKALRAIRPMVSRPHVPTSPVGTGLVRTPSVTARHNGKSTVPHRVATRPTFVADSRGTVIPTSEGRLASGLIRAGISREPTASPGWMYHMPDGTILRVMRPSPYAPLRISATNSKGGPIGVFSGKPVQPPSGLTKAQRSAFVRALTHMNLYR